MYINDLIVGKYYKHCWDTAVWYFRFEKIEDNKIYSFGWYIKSDNSELTFSKTSHKYAMKHELGDTFKKVDFKFIKSFLPLGHPDIIEHRNNRIKKLLKSF